VIFPETSESQEYEFAYSVVSDSSDRQTGSLYLRIDNSQARIKNVDYEYLKNVWS
jgi:hypothetical protein